MNCAVSMSVVSFVLPSAQCDFSLSSLDKGLLNAVPLLGKCRRRCVVYDSINYAIFRRNNFDYTFCFFASRDATRSSVSNHFRSVDENLLKISFTLTFQV